MQPATWLYKGARVRIEVNVPNRQWEPEEARVCVDDVHEGCVTPGQVAIVVAESIARVCWV